MRLIRMFGLAVLAALVATAFAGATSASANFPTQLCTEHVSLECPYGSETSGVHQVLATGTVGKLLGALVTILCLNFLVIAAPLSLGTPQEVHGIEMSFTGCGSSTSHNNCTVTTEEQPLFSLLKTGLDEGSLTALSGSFRIQCSNLGIDCKDHTAGSLFASSGGHLTANKTPIIAELKVGAGFCPVKGELDGLLETLEPTYVLE